jgi:hypothetical protein
MKPLMPSQDTRGEAGVQPVRGHDVLHAPDAIVRVPPDEFLRCVMADLAHAERKLAERRPRGPSSFTQAEVERVLKAVKAARGEPS